MDYIEKLYINFLIEKRLNCCKSCTLDKVLSENFNAYSNECLKCEHKYKTLYNTNLEYVLETLFNIEKEQKIIKYSEEIK